MGLELLRAEEFSRRGRVGGDASSHVLCAVLAAAAAPDAPCSFGIEHASAVADGAADAQDGLRLEVRAAGGWLSMHSCLIAWCR